MLKTESMTGEMYLSSLHSDINSDIHDDDTSITLSLQHVISAFIEIDDPDTSGL